MGTTSDAAFDAAFRRLRDGGAIQSDLPHGPPSEPPPDLAWLGDVGRFIAAHGQVFRVLLWGLLAVIVAWLLWEAYKAVRGRRIRARTDDPDNPEWRPELAEARSLLVEADKLAAAGRFADAVHLLLLRSVEQIAFRRQGSVRPGLTARDIAALERVPADIRAAFGSIAGVVEVSLFGQRPVGADDWAGARRTYEQVALPGGWR